jgi:FlaA1/EpsC-like NDP-sugar epimerase
LIAVKPHYAGQKTINACRVPAPGNQPDCFMKVLRIMFYLASRTACLARRLSEKAIAMSRRGKSAVMLGADCLALPLCVELAMLMRSSPLAPLSATLLLSAVSAAALAMSDLYGAVLRYLEQRMLARAAFGMAIAVLCIHLLTLDQATHYPAGALVTYWFVALAYLVASRVAVCSLLQRLSGPPPQAREAVAIYGAGDAGARLAQAMRADSRYSPICFFDEKHGRAPHTIAGLRVLPPQQLAETVAAASISLIVIALPDISGERLGAVLRMVRTSGVSVKFLHGLLDLADHAWRRQAPRSASFEFPLEQLLGRPPVPPDSALFGRCVRARSVLVTGAGGSIGSELCRQIASLGPRRLHLLDHCEFSLYTIRQELMAQWPQLQLRAHLGSVCNERLLDRIMQEDSIDTIYHAAANKHVNLVETNVVEGLRNNVLGARNVARIADKYLVETCVLVSSDKAVRPSTIMGASKRLSELVFQAAAQTAARDGGRTVFSMVRFGNVLGSSGSVVPLFRRQLQQGGPLTVTDAGMERYFMLIPEAAQLVIQAGAMAEGGEVFVLDMGRPIRIVDLARSMIALAGLTEKTAQYPHGDIEIQYVGLVPGEKLQEELLTEQDAVPSEHPRILRMKERALPPALLEQYIELLLVACDTNDRWLIEAMLKTIMSEFTPQTGAPAGADEALRAMAQLAQTS